MQGIIDRSDDSEHGRQTFLQLEPATLLSPASAEKVLQHQLIFCESKWWGYFDEDDNFFEISNLCTGLRR